MSYLIKGFVKPSVTPIPTIREELLTSMDTMMDEFFNHNLSGFAKSFLKDSEIKGSYPKVNLIDNGDHFLLEAAIPGYKKEDVALEIKDGVLTIRGRASTETDPGSKGVYLWREVKRSKFQRSFSLPENLNHQDTQASIEAGILSIKIPVKVPVPKKSDAFEVKIK